MVDAYELTKFIEEIKANDAAEGTQFHITLAKIEGARLAYDVVLKKVAELDEKASEFYLEDLEFGDDGEDDGSGDSESPEVSAAIEAVFTAGADCVDCESSTVSSTDAGTPSEATEVAAPTGESDAD
jgi:hypothetical protein